MAAEMIQQLFNMNGCSFLSLFSFGNFGKSKNESCYQLDRYYLKTQGFHKYEK